MGISLLLGLFALVAVVVVLYVVLMGAVVRWLDLDKADFSVGHKGVSIHMERRPRGQPTSGAKRSATRTRRRKRSSP